MSAKTPKNWADDGVLVSDGLLALIEVKMIPMRSSLGSSAVSIPGDVAALVSADWPATVALSRQTDADTGGEGRGLSVSMAGVCRCADT